MATVKQLFREFLIPFLIAVLWTTYALWEAPADRNFAGLAKTFSAAFFLASWASGQFVRVSRQARTESSLRTVESNIIDLTAKLEGATERLVNTVTGGASYAYLSLSRMHPNFFTPFVVHVGDHTLSNVSVRIVDLQDFQSNIDTDPFGSQIILSLGELPPSTAQQATATIPVQPPERDWNIFFGARNGFWTQQLRGRVVGNEWVFAWRITREIDGEPELLETKMPANFPMIGEHDFDHTVREPPVEST